MRTEAASSGGKCQRLCPVDRWIGGSGDGTAYWWEYWLLLSVTRKGWYGWSWAVKRSVHAALVMVWLMSRWLAER